MSSGKGRGRGWLNLKQSQNTPNPTIVGNLTSPPASQTNTVKEETQFSDIEKNTTDLVNKIRQLNLGDDGILFNQKIKYIVENWKNECHTSDEVE